MKSTIAFLICLVQFSTTLVSAFFPGAPKVASSWISTSPVSTNRIEQVSRPSSALSAKESDRNMFGSKLMPDPTEEQLAEMMREFNITSAFDINQDPELTKWYPTKEFFEKFAFVNMTEKYNRKTQDVKMEFYSAYRKPILPQYKTFIADLMAMTHIQTTDARYKYDALHAFGICTQYYTIMKGYALQEEIDVIFDEMMKAVRLNPTTIREDAKRLLSLIKENNQSEDDILNAKEGELAEIFNHVRTNRFFKYTDAWGVGLGRLIEVVGVEPKEESFNKWTASLRWVFTPRIIQTWDEFCGDQLRMQGIEAMQKQLLIREKKRSAARLEQKAAQFEDKKKALQELNEAIEERRLQLIEEQKALKKKYEPDAYERLVREEEEAKAKAALAKAGN